MLYSGSPTQPNDGARMSWPKQLDRFPLLTIERISKSIGGPSHTWDSEGVVSNCIRVLRPTQSIWLASDVLNSKGIGGEVISHDVATGRVVLHLWYAENLTAGDSLPLLNHDYNPYQVAMVLDESRRWARTRFTPRDAIATPGPDGFTCLKPVGGGSTSRYYAPREGDALPEATGQIRAAAWDHEHCEVCHASIGPRHQPEGYMDNQGYWVCCKCFKEYVATHDLSFIRLDYVPI